MTKFYPKNIQIRLFWSQIKAFLFSCKVLQLDKFEGPDFKYDNVVFKFQPKNTKNTVSIFEYVIKQYFVQNRNSWNLEPKMSSLYNSYNHIWNQYPRIYQNEKLCAKIKNLKFGAKKTFLSILDCKFEKVNVIFQINTLKFIQIPKIEQNNNDNSINKTWDQKLPYLGILTSRFEKLLLYLKSTPSNLSKCKVWCKNRNPK